MRACVYVGVRVCACARVRMHACFERYIGVCGCMSVEEARAGVRGRQYESETKLFFLMYLFSVLNFISNVASLSTCVTDFFFFFSFVCFVC